jgi:thiol-disulfide isomerase/thioredoxin
VKRTFSRTIATLALTALGILPACHSLQGSKSAENETAKKGLPNEPDVTFQDLQGKNVTLASYRGKAVLVNFWATWCEPCKIEIPGLIQLQNKYADKGFTILGVAMDDEGKKVVEPYVQNQKFDVDGQKLTMNYPIVLGNEEIAQKFGGLIGFPTSVLISRDGKVVKRIIGLVNQDTLEKDIRGLL